MTRLACGRTVPRRLQSLEFWESWLCAMAKQLLKFRTLDLGKELKGITVSAAISVLEKRIWVLSLSHRLPVPSSHLTLPTGKITGGSLWNSVTWSVLDLPAKAKPNHQAKCNGAWGL